ncbi:hypothetical protein BH20CHL1_BH20CHL1_10050 [soil metagenome]
MSKQPENDEDEKTRTNIALGLSLGVAFGISAGVVIGILTDNFGL